jgi:VanZ family protein
LKNIEYVARFVLIACAATILWLALSPNPPNPAGLFDLDKVNHVGAFFVLSLLADYSYLARGALVPKGMALLGFGLLIEGLQYWVGYRYFEVSDLIADGGGIVLYGLVRNPVRAMLDPMVIGKK